MQLSIRNKWISLRGSSTVKDLAEKECAIHIDTVSAYNQICMLKELS